MNHDESSAILNFDILFNWNSLLDNVRNQCHLKIYKKAFDQALIIISKLPHHLNYSISEEIINLINLVCHQFDLSPQKTMWVERYTINRVTGQAIFYQVFSLEEYIYRNVIEQKTLETISQIKL